MSQQGVRQGCPLVPSSFALVSTQSGRLLLTRQTTFTRRQTLTILLWSPLWAFDNICLGVRKLGLTMAPGKVVLVCRKPSSLTPAFLREAKARDISIADSTVLLGTLVGAPSSRILLGGS